MDRYLLSVDNGGTYIKAAIFNTRGSQIGLVKHYNTIMTPHPGYAEYDQDTLWQTNCRCIREVIEETGIPPEQIACIGIAGQGGGFYAVDQQGRNIRNAVASSDRRSQPQVEAWMEQGISDLLYRRIYRKPLSGHLCSILAWLKEHEPDNYKRIHCLFSMKDFLIYRLTGKLVAGYDCQSASGIMNLETLTFDRSIAEKLGIPEMADKFGDLRWSFEICGTVTPEAAGLCGCLPGTPVSSGLHDVIASALAMGITDPEHCFMITGTHAINGYISPTPVLNGTIKNNELFAFPGMFLIEEGYPSSSATLEWVIDVLYENREQPEKLYEQINNLVEQIRPDEEIPVFLPFLRGQRDNPYARGSWIGLRPEHGRAHMLRAVYEGVVFSHMLQLEYLFMNRERPSRILIAGGAVKSGVWMQIFADAIGIPITIVPLNEMGAQGVAMVSAAAIGIYPDIQTAVREMTEPGTVIYPRSCYADIYNEKFTRFKSIVGKTDTIWRKER